MARITYLGNFKHAWCTENLISRALGRMGHEVIRMQEDEAGLYDIVEQANKSDLFLWGLTYNMLNCDGNKMIEKIKVPKAGFHLDVFFGTDREKLIDSHPYFKMDYFFSTDGDPKTIERFKKSGVNIHYIPAACAKEECYLAPPVKDFEHDIVFVGSTKYHSEYPYRPLLIDWLRSVYGSRFVVYPEDREMTVQGHQLNQLYASSKIVIGDSFNRGGEQSYYWSNRVPETTGHGGCLIHPFVKGIEDYYVDKQDLLLYHRGDFDKLGSLIDYYLYHDQERNEIKRNGMLKTKQNHTFDNVIEEMFRIMRIKNDI